MVFMPLSKKLGPFHKTSVVIITLRFSIQLMEKEYYNQQIIKKPGGVDKVGLENQ